MAVNQDTPQWLVMPTTAIEPKLEEAEQDFGLYSEDTLGNKIYYGQTKTIFRRIDNDGETAVSIVGDHWRSMQTSPIPEYKGKSPNDKEMMTYIKDVLGIAIGKPLDSDNDLKAAGWPQFQDDI